MWLIGVVLVVTPQLRVQSTLSREQLPGWGRLPIPLRGLVALADQMLPAHLNGRPSARSDVEQQTGDDGCSDLLSASQRRFSSEDGRRCVTMVEQDSQAA